ncbi:PACE efflux transporter [Pasteurellaceae bacterium 22721_9_1]
MSPIERFFHAVLFEILAIFISIIAIKLFSHHPTTETTIVVVLISVIAVIWNMIFNWIFDLFFTGAREKRSFKLRLFHTFAFEGGLLLFTLPVVAYVLQINYLAAFIMDIGLTLLILVYTFIFNWLYDNIRANLIKKRA